MKTVYKGFEIEVKREKALGEWENTYFTVYRQSDGLEIIDDFTSGSDEIDDFMKAMKARVDELIATNGESECIEPGLWIE